MARTKKSATASEANSTNRAGSHQGGAVEPKTLQVEVTAAVEGAEGGTTTTQKRTTRKTKSTADQETSPKPTTTRRRTTPSKPQATTGGEQVIERLDQQRHEAGQQLEEIVRQTREAGERLRTLREDQEKLGMELERLREQSRNAHQEFLRETLEGSDRLQRNLTETMDQLETVKRMFRDAGQQFLQEFEGQLAHVRSEVQTTGQLLQNLPQQAQELGERLAEVAQRLPDAERQLASVEEESRQAQHRLEAIRHEAASAEERLTAARRELAETAQRLQQTRQKLERVTREARQAEEDVERARQEAREVAALAAAPVDGRKRLGVTVEPGVVVAEVLPDSPAAVAGFVRGDVITGVNGKPVLTGQELREVIRGLKDGDEFTLQVTRAGIPSEVKAQRVAVPPEEAPAGEDQNQLGVAVEPGVVVAEVVPDSPAAAAGVTRGDVITAVNGVPVVHGEQLRQAMQPLPARSDVRLEVCRAGELREVTTRLDSETVTGDRARESGTEASVQPAESAPAAAATRTEAGETIQLHEERLRAHKTPVETGEVRVRKEVTTEQQNISVPVTHEEVVVERRPAAGQASSADIRAGEEIRIPVKEEKVHVEKDAVVTEEVSVGKRKVTDTEQVSGTVRKEQVKVEQSGDVNVRSSTNPPKRTDK